MLTAILHGKAGRVEIDGRHLSWRTLFRKREDLLTSVLFGRLPYLSDGVHDAFLRALLGNEHRDDLGQLIDIQFWPRLSESDGRRYVEPDVLIEYQYHRLLIEVKPPFGGMQTSKQWRAEVQALHRQNDEPKQIILLALGRNHLKWRSSADKLEREFSSIALRVVCLNWPEFLRRLGLIRDLADSRDERVFQDWFEAFRLFGMVSDTMPFSDLLPLCNEGDSFRKQLGLVQSWTGIKKIPTRGANAQDWAALLPIAQLLEKEELVQWT